MMNQTKKHTTGKKLLALLLALIMTVSLLPMSVFAAEMDAEETPVVEGQTEPAAEPGADDADQAQEPDADEANEDEAPVDEGEEDAVLPGDAEGDADDADADAADDGIATFAATDEETVTPFTVDEDKAIERTEDGGSGYRAVMLDCGRKYFTVKQIETLIDTMAQYKYNQLQLSFGNGGCRFLLDDMGLVFTDENGSTVTLSSDTVKSGITSGNETFNGDKSVLTETQMTEIIKYAKGKGIDIVPMLNMPGHATAIASVNDAAYAAEYDKTKEKPDKLDITNATARHFGYALLNKYAQYFSKYCKFFHFGADESGYTGSNMTNYLTGCANVIMKAGMIPRAFNDSTREATMPKSVQITYWIWADYIESQQAAVLDGANYELINTHGRWYYVVNSGNADTSKSVQYSNNVTVELPMTKKTGLQNWPNNLRTYFDSYNSTVSEANHRGTMFCIWCDNSTEMPGDAIISTNEKYGALYQIQELAKLYWGDEIDTSGGDTGDTVTEQNVQLEVGQSFGPDEVTGNVTAGEQITDDNKYIATAYVTTGTAQAASYALVSQLTSGKKYLITPYRNTINTILLTNDGTGSFKGYSALKLSGTLDANSTQAWTLTVTSVNGDSYTGTLQDTAGKYLTIGNLTASVSDTQNTLTLTCGTVSGSKYWTIGQSVGTYTYYLNQLGGESFDSNLVAGGYRDSAIDTNPFSDTGNCWNFYEITEATTGGNTLTITGTGEGNTEVTVGNTKYIINVTAPEKTENVSVTPNGTTTLQPDVPADGSVTYTLGANEANVKLDAGVVTASEKTGSATVTAEVKNAGGKVVAHYTYTITVSEIDFSKVEPLKVELWSTNQPIGKNENSVNEHWCGLTIDYNTTWGQVSTDCTPAKMEILAEDAYGQSGELLADHVISTGVAFTNKGEYRDGLTYLYWKGVVLQDGLKQLHANETGKSDYEKRDQSGNGVDFEMIRFWENKWQYYANDMWNDVKDDDTLIAYYLQQFVISPELDTAFRDYGNIAGKGAGEEELTWFSGFYGIATAVVYPDYSMSPNGDKAIYDESLMLKYVSTGTTSTDLGCIKVFEPEEYKISKITITQGVHADSSGNVSTAGNWKSTDTVNWNKERNEAGFEWYKETTIWTPEGYTGGPFYLDQEIWDKYPDECIVSGSYTDCMNKAFLILIYLEPVANDDSLKVVYYDDNAGAEIKTMDIVVNEGVTFDNDESGIQNNTADVIKGQELDLDDAAYITNKQGGRQPFNKNIALFQDVAAKYRSGLYVYTGADVSKDGKTLTLHYNLQGTVKQYVVDFGLPVTIKPSDFGVTDKTTIADVSLAATKGKHEGTGVYGEAKIDTATWEVTYKLTKTLNDMATIPLYVTFNNETAPMKFSANIIPASNVYYEDSFVTFNSGKMGETELKWTPETDGIVPSNTQQALEELGKSGVYGYDTAYDNCTMFSMGSAMKVTVDSSVTVNPTATFTFRGTGFDVISLTDNRSGAIAVDVYRTSDNEKVKSHFVNNYYGYKYTADGGWEVVKPTEGAESNALYQIPVMKVADLPYAEYKVVITAAYSSIFDTAKSDEYSFWLDAVRVYDPMGKEFDYKDDGEGWPQYIRLQKELAKNKGTVTNTGALFIDGKENADIEEYTSYGPNNEVYLAKDQSIAFKLEGDIANIAKVQIGAKAPMENGSAKLTVNSNDVTRNGLTTATEMYYDITEYAITGEGTNKTAQIVTITNTGDTGTILSLTNVKVTFNTAPENSESKDRVTFTMTEEDATAAVAMVRAMYAPAEPEVFVPERFEASWNRSTVKVGQKATLTVKTSTDVDAITVDGATVTNYRTRTQRTGWGWNATKVTYREFTYTITAAEAGTLDVSVVAINADGVSSEPITAALTVQAVQRPQRPSWLDKIFSRWF